MAKEITKKCAYAVQKLAIKRKTVGSNTRVFEATWALPANAKNSNNVARAEKVRVSWHFSKKSKKSKSTPTHTIDGGTSFVKSEKGLPGTWGKKTYTRDSFYPVTSWKVHTIWLNVLLGNKKGWGKKVSASFKFEKPRAPVLGSWSFNKETGVATINIKTNAGLDKYERYDTRYQLEVKNTRTGKTYYSKNTSSQSTDFNVTFNAGDYQKLEYGQYIRLILTAWSRGLKGDSSKVSKTLYISWPAQTIISNVKPSSTDPSGKCTVYIDTNYNVSKKKNIAHPVDRVKLEYLANVEYSAESQIPADANWEDANVMDDSNCSALSVAVSKVIPSKGNYSWVRVKSYHLVEEVLYRYSKAFRIKKLEAPAPTAADDDIVIISATTGMDGESAVIHLGWNEDGQDDATGTELTWSDDEYAWKSTKDPDEYRFTWSDGPATVTIDGQERTFRDSAEIFIRGLGEGSTYYIRARRYMEGDKETYSEYSNTLTVVTNERPETIVADCARYVPQGEALTVSWTFSGNGLQREWQILAVNNKFYPAEGAIVYVPTKDGEIYTLTEDTEIDESKTYYRIDDQNNYVVVEEPNVEEIGEYYEKSGGVIAGKTYYTRSEEGEYTEVQTPVDEDIDTYYEQTKGIDTNKTYYTRTGTEGNYEYQEVVNPVSEDVEDYFEVSKGTIIANGQNAIGSTQIDYGRLKTFAENESVTLVVQASTGSDFVTSEQHQVSLIEKPVMELGTLEPLRSQPFTFNVTSDRACDLTVIVTSNGISGQMPQGIVVQAENDTIHSDVYTPEWESIEEDTLTTSVTLPDGLDFWDTGNYTLSVVGTDRGTGLHSEPIGGIFTVEWSHQAPDPSEAVTVTPVDEVDEGGVHHLSARIDFTPPAGSEATDVYDLYRMDNGNPHLIGAGLPLTHTATDEYAPFGEGMTLYYRVAIRTIDGDVEFADLEYTFDFKAIRLDWAEGFLELPYDISIGDSYKKDVDIRQHLDGNMDGYWNNAVERKGSLSTNVVRLIRPEDIERSRSLARYAGPVFVRTPDGSAYAADVQVTDMSLVNREVTAISLDCTEINVTSEFQLPPIISEEEEPEETEE